MKVKKLENVWDKSGLTGCKWSGLNAPGTETPLSHPILKLDEFPFPQLALWGNKNWLPSMKVEKLNNFQNKRGSAGCKWSSLNAPGTETPLSHLILKLQYSLFPLLALWVNNFLAVMGPPHSFVGKGHFTQLVQTAYILECQMRILRRASTELWYLQRRNSR